MIDLFVEAGIDADATGGYDESTPLHSAAWNDSLEVAKKLVAAGADINKRSGEIHNNSPAGWAIVAGSADVFNYLMDQGAEKLDHFMADAQASARGKHLQYKCCGWRTTTGYWPDKILRTLPRHPGSDRAPRSRYR